MKYRGKNRIDNKVRAHRLPAASGTVSHTLPRVLPCWYSAHGSPLHPTHQTLPCLIFVSPHNIIDGLDSQCAIPTRHGTTIALFSICSQDVLRNVCGIYYCIRSITQLIHKGDFNHCLCINTVVLMYTILFSLYITE